MKCICIDEKMKDSPYDNVHGYLFKKFRIYDLKINRSMIYSHSIKDETVKNGTSGLWAPFMEDDFNRYFRVIEE